ncbi:AMP-binding protein [[Mycobacterium] wendilense]|uniref:AMP-binding protein n=1 Tax=[Mycobacterium] wendilense TaxID=3064284 RepID=A0ABN9P4G4_9MYCO|nr:AMP-binding protein [Mycolicibacterium sp. MU0050]CAJ1586858.1 AMP-binding protein [Mycolicibacterium sp. MU0050]
MSGRSARPQSWWNVADICEAIAAATPAHVAISQGERRVTWTELNRRADGVAAALLHAGLEHQDRVALYLNNAPEYIESFVAATKASLVPVNTNFRYRDAELAYLWNNADAAAVVFHGAFTETAGRVRHNAPTVKQWIWVDDGTAECPDWATPYETAAATPAVASPRPRSTDDLIFLYTGGTTGMPKGVVFKQRQVLALPMRFAPTDLDVLIGELRQRGHGDTILIGPPLMHGTGMMAALQALLSGGTVSLLPSRRFDPLELWDTAERDDATQICIVGDAFARPMLDALRTHRDRWKLQSLTRVISAGVMFSAPLKRGLMDLLPGLSILDQLGSTENGTAGTCLSEPGTDVETGTFDPTPGVRVIDSDNRDVQPGSGAVGRIAIPGGAVGYHKDPDRSAQTFVILDGRRYTVAGDFAIIESDGRVRLLGRGSQCINTGGEKVFAEEVEEVLKCHRDVKDALVVGTPDDRFGEVVTAVVEASADVTDDQLIHHVKDALAAYKAPKHIVRVDSLGRSPNGKADYPAIRTLAVQHLGAAADLSDEVKEQHR